MFQYDFFGVLPGAYAWPKRDVQSQTIRDPGFPDLVTEGQAPGDRPSNTLERRPAHRPIHLREPVTRPMHQPAFREQRQSLS